MQEKMAALRKTEKSCRDAESRADQCDLLYAKLHEEKTKEEEEHKKRTCFMVCMVGHKASKKCRDVLLVGAQEKQNH